MNIRTKVLTSLAGMMVLFCILDYIVQHRVVLQGFLELEEAEARRELAACADTISREVDHLRVFTRDWGYWDDTYAFVADRNEEFVRTNLTHESMKSANVGLMCLFDVNGKAVHAKAFEPGSFKAFDLEGFTAEHFKYPQLLLGQSDDPDRQNSGLLLTARGPMIFAASPILTSQREGPSRGTLIVGRFLSDEKVRSFSDQLRVPFRIWSVNDEIMETNDKAVFDRIRRGEYPDPRYIAVKDPDCLHSYTVLPDLFGEPAVLLVAHHPREIYQRGIRSVQAATASVALSGALVLIAAVVLLQRLVVGPIMRLTEHAIAIGASGSMTQSISNARKDEIGKLSREFEHMLVRIEQVRLDAEADLRRNAFHDPLTALPNRAYLMDRLEQCLERSRRDPRYRFGVLFLDLDNFKLVNDSLGHQYGDQLLIETSHRLRKCLRSMDTVARTGESYPTRIGGDEFVIILDGIELAVNGALVAERILSALTAPFQLGGQEVTVNASIGITISDTNYTRADELLRDADTAMYRAKNMGKGRFAMFHQDMHNAARLRLQLENELRRAVHAQEFEIHYQPIVALPDFRITALEALLRWRRRDGGWSPPDQFIPIAEECGLIVPLGNWALGEVCRQLVEWRGRYGDMRTPKVNVNVSRRQLMEGGLAEEVDTVLRQHEMPARFIDLEITEGGIIGDLDRAAQRIRAFKSLGIGLHMDDFGTGYSSLACLHRFPLDVVKIDKSFAATMIKNTEYASIIQAIIAIAHTLNMKVTVEGIETQRQLDLMISLGCDFAQGFLFAKPMPASRIEEIIEAGRVLPLDVQTLQPA